MSQTPGDKSVQSAVARSEALWNNLGQRISFLAARTGQRIQSTATSIREEANRKDLPKTDSTGQSSVPPGAQTEESAQLATARAEQMVDRLGQRINYFTARTGLQVQKARARMREEAEDIWAEAQHIRHRNEHTS